MPDSKPFLWIIGSLALVTIHFAYQELRQRIGELTMLLEQKEREIATWKGTAETREKR